MSELEKVDLAVEQQIIDRERRRLGLDPDITSNSDGDGDGRARVGADRGVAP